MKITMLAAAAGLAFCCPAANAAVNIYISDTAAGAFTQTLGSLDLTGVTLVGQASMGLGIRGKSNTFYFTGQPSGIVNAYGGLTGPVNGFGSNLMSNASSTAGKSFGFNMGTNRVFLPTDYVSGGVIDSSATYAFKTVSSLGLIVGDYVYTLGSDTITVHVGQAAPPAVPEPAAWALMLCGFGAIGAALRGRRMTAVRFG